MSPFPLYDSGARWVDKIWIGVWLAGSAGCGVGLVWLSVVVLEDLERGGVIIAMTNRNSPLPRSDYQNVWLIWCNGSGALGCAWRMEDESNKV